MAKPLNFPLTLVSLMMPVFRPKRQVGSSQRAKKMVRAVPADQTAKLRGVFARALPKRVLSEKTRLSFYQNIEGKTFASAIRQGTLGKKSFDVTVYSIENNNSKVRASGAMRVEGNSLYIYDVNPGGKFWNRDYSGPKPSGKGRFLFRVFVEEAIRNARKLGLSRVTLDAGSEKLVSYYSEFGFRFKFDRKTGMWPGTLGLK